jgi:peptidoglycan/xylan/chitin deacetylase (PgdA/CDA1 family)
MGVRSAILGLCVLVGAAVSAPAAECPGNADALGTSRIISVDPAEHTRIGTMQYHETLPLEDHEVVLTFDDGPLPPYTNRVLETLAAECVKATFFMVGRQARAYPDMARKVYNEGHTIASHSQNHPLIFTRLSMAAAENEIEQGRASVEAALGDERAMAPFFRFPGLGRSNAIEDYLASRGLMTWSADFPADDWMHISAQQVLNRALDRLERKGRGVLLLHDIQPRTAIALPVLLKELKARGYRIVHVVPAGPERPKTLAPPEAWVMHRPPAWPRVLERDPAFAETARAYPDQIDLPVTLAAAPSTPGMVAMPLIYPTPGRSRLWPSSAQQFAPVDAQLFPVSYAGSRSALAVGDVSVSWLAENVIWPPVHRPARLARPKHPVHVRPPTTARPGRPPRAVVLPPVHAPHLASHILTLH